MDLYTNDDPLVLAESSRLPKVTRLLENPESLSGHETTNQTSTGSTQQTSVDVSSVVFLLGVLLFIFVFSVLKYWLCEGPAAARRQNQERVHRRELIRERILSKTVVQKVQTPSDESQQSSRCSSTLPCVEAKTEGGLDKDHRHKIRRQKTDLEISASQHNPDDSSRAECQICLSDFQVGDKICWSNNPLCVHAFHIDCLEPWLMKHNHCPLCRNDYLVPPQMDPKTDEVESPNNTGDVRHADNVVRIRGILGDIILPFFHHSSHPVSVTIQIEGNSTLPSTPPTSDVMVHEEITHVESPLQLETNSRNHSLHAERFEDIDCFDVETGQSFQLPR